MGQQPLTTDLDGGNRFNQDVVLQALVLSALRQSLSVEVTAINQALWENDMREVSKMAADMRGMVANLKKLNTDAQSGLAAEVSRANVNAEKIKAFTQELKDANLEVESFLGETGSNFSTSEKSDTSGISDTQQQGTVVPPDKNGVTLNSETSK